MKKLIPIFLLLLPAVIFSFGGNCGGNGDETLISSRLLNAVTLDGQITSSEEWADTDAYDISLDSACCWPNKQVVKDAGVVFHTDAVATAGTIPVNVNEIGVDALSLAGNQMYGPRGSGALWVRDGVRIIPFLDGGVQDP